MASFYDFELRAMSSEELDHYALECNGVVARISEGYALRSEVPPQHDWGFRWISTGGCGNQGTLVLVPRSNRSRAIAHDGFVRRVMALAQVSEDEAEAYVFASKGVQYAKEPGVIRAAFATKESPSWGFFNVQSVRRWIDEWRMESDFEGLSVPRIMSVREITQSL